MKKFITQTVFFIFLLWPFCITSAEAFSEKISTDTYTSSKVCGECHKDIYGKWKNSIHAHAIDDPIFDAAYTEAYRLSNGEAKFLCLKCHAPTVALTKDYDIEKEITKEGVTCDFCHSVKGVDPYNDENPYQSEVGITKRGPLKNSDTEDHKSAYSKLHEKAEFCAGCHEFKGKNGVSILGTYSEWKAGPYSKKGIQCQNCHMPLTRGEVASQGKGKKKKKRLINEHNLMGGHSITQVKKALHIKIISAKKEGNRLNVLIDVTNKGSGHKVPTGIPTRKLLLKVVVKTASGRDVQQEMFYEKTLIDKDGKTLTRDSEIMLGRGVEISKDNRIKPKETRRESFTFFGIEEDRVVVSAEIEYQYTPLLLQPVEMKIKMTSDEKVLE